MNPADRLFRAPRRWPAAPALQTDLRVQACDAARRAGVAIPVDGG
jgi:hypothetical protein